MEIGGYILLAYLEGTLMKRDKKELLKKINKLRTELTKKYCNNEDHQEILGLSSKLDKLIVMYYQDN